MKKSRSINNSLRARSISKTYQPAFFHLGECATYQPAIDQSDWPIQKVIVQTQLGYKDKNISIGDHIVLRHMYFRWGAFVDYLSFTTSDYTHRKTKTL